MRFAVKDALRGDRPQDVARRGVIVGVVSFLTLIDLFGSQALLPRLVQAYGVDAATMGFAVNASTIGMAISGLVVAYFADRIDRKRGIWISLALLSVPTFLLGLCEDATTFMLLRILQGVFMSAAFTLTLTYLSEQCDVIAAAGAMSAYITGNVASNLFGRIMAVGVADGVGLSESFFAFAVLNLLGALLAFFFIGASSGPPARSVARSPVAAWTAHLARPELRASFAIGFLILFVFIGVFTYVNFALTAAPHDLSPSQLGLVYLVFAPALLTTAAAGRVARSWGVRRTFWASIGLSLAGLAMLLAASTAVLLVGLSLIGVGLFFAQGAATGYVGRTATTDRAAANGLYLTSYYVGGLVGAFALGQVYERAGWSATVAVMAAALLAAALLAVAMQDGRTPADGAQPMGAK